MWEVYATLAPLEAVLQPEILDHLMTWLHGMTPQSLCPLKTEETKPGEWMWPFFYVTAGGLRLLLTTGENENLENACDDTLMLVIGKITVSPHPENPICRQSVNPGTDSSWTPLSPGLDGRQYEVLIRHLAIRSAQLNQLVNQEETESEMLKGTGSENPALKWSQPVVSPAITPLLHSVDVGCILAPPIYSEGAIISGPAVELNLLSDCSVEMGVESIELVQTLVQKVLHVFRQRSESSLTLEEENICPYAAKISNQETTETVNIDSEPTTETQETPKSSTEPNRSYIFDSGVETTTSQSTYKNHRDSVPMKKSVSIVGADHTAKPSDYLEVYVTMGVVDFSLYAKDDDSREVRALRPPPGQYTAPSEPNIKVVIDESKEIKTEEGKESMAASRSLTETIRNVDIGKTKLELMHILPLARKAEGNVPLLHATLHQPNLYYLSRKKQKTIQISLFNAWIGLGVGPGEGHWNAPLLTTARGSPDPVTDIPPALATLRVDLSPGGFPSFTSASGRGNVQLDIERPVMLEVSTDSLQRLKGIIALVEKNVVMTNVPVEQSVEPPIPLLYKIRKNMVGYEVESVIVHTGQIGVRGSEGAVGCDGVRLQLAIGERPQRLTCRVLLTAAIVTSGPDSDRRHVVLQPLMAGAVIDATWEAWKRAEGGPSACEPTLRIGIDLDRISLDLRPSDLATVARIHDDANEIFGFTESQLTSESTVSQESLKSPSSDICHMPTNQSTYANQQSTTESDHTNHFYKDDLRSGAFKIVSGCQLPMAYQVTLHGSTVSWRYPHPRAITRLIAYPMPNLEVLITSETVSPTDEASGKPPPIVQTASGRGTTTQIIAPGTTSARHTLTFQYRNIECPVTREAVPLHYGMTETSVFDKPTPVANIEDAVDMIQQWLQKSSRDARSDWPYSIVTNHLPGEWQPALLQPRCDVTIRYEAVRAGGGCSLELQLSPVALLANASPITLTLRAYDAAPLCRIEPGVAISPPSIVLQKPFFMSVEVGRETFVSGQLQVCKEEQGRYGQPPPGYIALDKAANFAVQCNQKVALLTMYYELKEEINVLGVTSTYMLINRLRTDILVSAIAAPKEMDNSTLRPKTFKIVEPTIDGSLQGTALCRFWMNGRWRGGDVDELRAFLCLALPTTVYQANSSVPIRLGMAPVRRAIALKNDDGQSVPIVVTQVKHEARWLITIAEDPCPQFLVHNRTKTTLAVAQPVKDDDNTGIVKTVQDCMDVRWWCVVESHGVTHYSTPSYCSRYPPPPQSELRNPLPFLTVGHCRDEGSYEWCHPIAIADGEQLLQLTGDVTVKLRVRTYPHSTVVELQDVDQNDISASDIRRRLLGAFEEDTSQQNKEPRTADGEYRRLSADSKRTGSLSGVSVAEDVDLVATSSPTNPSTSQQVQSEQATMSSDTNKTDDSSRLKLSGTARDDITQAYKNEIYSATTVARKDSTDLSETSCLLDAVSEKDWSDGNEVWPEKERFRCLVTSVVVTVGASSDELPLLALHMQRVSVLVQTDARKTKTTLSVADVQIDNAQYETEQYDFAVVATTRAEVTSVDRWPALWGMFNERLPTLASKARLYLRTCHDRWVAANREHQELTELELLLGPLGLYVEDAYVASALELIHLAAPPTAQTSESTAITEINTLQNPLRLRKLLFHPLDLTLTLHTAVRMYIALDESPLRLSAFQLQDVMTSSERLTHALTVHYLSAAILGAGWVVGGLELLGAPGALAARVGSAGGGVRGVASAAAGALLRSLSSAAGSLARNLDLLAGDDEHAKRAAAARRRPPPNLMAGLVAGVTNFAINLLGAVGGLAHHPLVGVAVGESESGAAALRRGLVGAITKPLSATADLVAYAGHGLLTQTGWDPVPQPKGGTVRSLEEISIPSGWRRDCVRWGFRFAELGVLTGFEAELDGTPVQLLFTHKYLVMIDAETERIYEMIDFKFCTIGPYQSHVIELYVKQKRSPRLSESRVVVDEDNEVQISAAAMARVARYTGAEGYDTNETRLLTLLPPPSTAHALRAVLCAVLHANVDTHFTLL